MKYFINTNQKNNNAQRKKPFSLNLRQKAGIFLLSSLTIGLASAMPSMDVISSKSIRISLDGTESYSFAPLMPDDLLKESDFVNSNDVFVEKFLTSIHLNT